MIRDLIGFLMLIGLALIVVAVLILGIYWGLVQSGFIVDSDSFTYRHQQVEQCMATEQYTKDQCVILVGSS